MIERMKLKVKEVIRRRDRDDDSGWRRYMVPLADDLPLLKHHYEGEYFERIDGRSLVRRWKDKDGMDHHELLFYPAPGSEAMFDAMESGPEWEINYYFLLLWKLLNKFGVARYASVPHDIRPEDFDRFLNKPVQRMQLSVKPQRLQLKVEE